MITFRPHQIKIVDAVEAAFRAGINRPLIDSCVGSGKSFMYAELARREIDRGGRVIIGAHTEELVAQNADACRKIGLPVGINSAGLGERVWRAPVISASIQSVFRHAQSFGPITLLCTDECFPYDTLIATPDGDVPIGRVRVGDTVHHALGVGTVQACSQREVTDLVEIEFDDGRTLWCTENHQLFTLQGWAPAKCTSGGIVFTFEGVQSLRNDFLSGQEVSGWIDQSKAYRKLDQTRILLDVLRQEKSETVYSLSGRAPAGVRTNESASRKSEMPTLQSTRPASEEIQQSCMERYPFLLDILLQEAREPNARPGGARKDDCDTSQDRASAENTRREWAPLDETASSVAGSARAGMGIGVSGADLSTARLGMADMLQNRYSESDVEDCYRSGREFAHRQARGARPEERRHAATLGVVRVSRIKLKSPCNVYNLQVSGHPSYFANGILAHNCHLIGHSESGMYRELHRNLGYPRLVGGSGTVFRLQSGSLVEGEDAPFDQVVFRYSIVDGINDGYLVPAFSLGATDKIDPTKLRIRNGEYTGESSDAQMIQAMDNHIAQMVAHGWEDRKAWLVFEASTKSAIAMAGRMRQWGIPTGIVLGKTPPGEAPRDEQIAAFRAGRLRALVNINALCVGFDVPQVDLLVMRRRTQSLGLYIQMCGRVLRCVGGDIESSIAAGKSDAAVLDFAGNIDAHGPLDFIKVKNTKATLTACEECGKRNRSGAMSCWSCGAKMSKNCPMCLEAIPRATLDCPACGFDMRKGPATESGAQKLSDTPSGAALISSLKGALKARAGGWVPIRKAWDNGQVDDVSGTRWTLPAGLAPHAADARWLRAGLGEEVEALLLPNGSSRVSALQVTAAGMSMIVPLPATA